MRKSYKLSFILAIYFAVITEGRAQIHLSENLKGAYFGQKPPGETAAIFAQGIVSTDSIEHSAPSFSPDGNIVLWTKIYAGKPAFLVEMRRENGTWTQPGRPSFSGTDADDFYLAFSADGKTLYFSSRRPLPKGYPKPGYVDLDGGK